MRTLEDRIVMGLAAIGVGLLCIWAGLVALH